MEYYIFKNEVCCCPQKTNNLRKWKSGNEHTPRSLDPWIAIASKNNNIAHVFFR